MNPMKQLLEDRGDIRKTLNGFTNERASKFTDLRALGKKEALTDEEQTKYDNLKNDINSLDGKIDRAENELSMLNTQIENEKKHGDKPLNGNHGTGLGNPGFLGGDSGPTSEEKELQGFSFMNAVAQAVDGNYEGFIKEMREEGINEAKEAGVEISNRKSLIIPQKVLRNVKLSRGSHMPMKNTVTAGTQGQRTIETEDIDFVSLLRERLMLTQLGARFASGLTGNIPLNRQTAGFVFGWAATENAAADKSSATYDGKTLSPKRGTGYMDVSNQWLIQTSPEIESLLVNDILTGTQVGIEKAAISGSGADGEPEGLLNTSGILSAFAGGAVDNSANANGAAQAWDDWVNLEKLVEVNNADMGTLGYATTPKVKGQARLSKIDEGSGIFIWDKLMAENARIGVGNIVPDDLTKGNNEDNLSALIYGNWNDLWVGMWSGIELMVNPYTKAKTAETEMIIHVYVDTAVRRPESFAAIKDIDAQ